MNGRKLAEVFLDYLVEDGYTHCFFLAGGNIMHLLDAARTRFVAVPFVHEVSATIAAEYFNHVSDLKVKAFVLVTAGPGLTNAVTGIAGAWLESREVLILGGQVKSTDLKSKDLRQLGIQELDGVSLVESITKISQRIETEADLETFVSRYSKRRGRKGPIFMEWCLDAQARIASPNLALTHPQKSSFDVVANYSSLFQDVKTKIQSAERPILLIGAGLERSVFLDLLPAFEDLAIPLQFTWNAADYLPNDHPLNFGRPNTWGQLPANLVIQQSDLLVAIGARLGLQQTGFAWEEFAPLADIVQIDVDTNELLKGRPRVTIAMQMDAAKFARDLASSGVRAEVSSWMEYCNEIFSLCPSISEQNSKNENFVQPQEFMSVIASMAPIGAWFASCSSGGTFTVAMQALKLREGQRLISNKALASMGYGTAAAIGLSLADPLKSVIAFEGDGGFAQNLQELGTASWNKLNVKFFVFSNSGYASIRMTQRNYFDGNWIGCDRESGLGLPNLKHLAETYDIPFVRLDGESWRPQVDEVLQRQGPVLIEVPVDPDQTYFPKIGSKVLEDGSMRSSPLHQMQPELSLDLTEKVARELLNRGEK